MELITLTQFRSFSLFRFRALDIASSYVRDNVLTLAHYQWWHNGSRTSAAVTAVPADASSTVPHRPHFTAASLVMAKWRRQSLWLYFLVDSASNPTYLSSIF